MENKTILQPNLSPEQTDAANPDKNVWVRANAGTGKTTVLIRRLLKLMLGGARMDSIMCLTYTNAAAAEIKERILKSLEEFATATDAELKEKLDATGGGEAATARALFYEYIENMDSLKIQTVHGFCQEILRRFPTEAGINPAWVLMSDGDNARMAGEAFEKFWEEGADPAARDALMHIADKVSETGMGEVQDLVTGLYKNFFSLGFDINNAKQFVETSRKSFRTHNFDKNGFSAPERMNFRKIYGEKLRAACAGQDSVKNASELADAMLGFAAGSISFEEYRGKFIDSAFEKKKLAGITEKKFGPEIVSFIMAEQAELYESAQGEAQEELSKDTAALYILAAKFAEEFRRAKEDSARLHYDDLILYTMRLFSSQDMMGWVMSQLDSKIRHLMVDEAQDTSPDQWEIVRSLLTDFFVAAGRPSVFVVGDPKQSIFSFQGASIDSFFAAEEYIGRQVRENRLELSRIDFEKSYRTAQNILDAVDHVFNHDSTLYFTKWKQATRHLSGRDGAEGKVVLHRLVRDESDEESNSAARQKAFAKTIAENVKRMLSAQPDLVPGDIMVLVKKRTTHAPNIIAALNEAGVPTSGADRMHLADALPVRDLLAAMRFATDQTDDFSLACVLRSPLFEVSDKELYGLCNGREGTLKEEVRSKKAEGLYEELEKIIEWGRGLGPYSFAMKLLDTEGRRENMLRRMGAQIIEPLEEFLTLALSYERTQAGGIVQFIEWFLRGESVVKRDMQSGGGVRVMTAYGAKGLEARVVFLADTTSIKGKDDANPIVPISGRGHWIWAAGKGKLCADYAALREAYEAKELEEYYRLLYVAMTRARDELHIFGTAGKRGPDKNSWYELLAKVLPEFPGCECERESQPE
ncbi:MAG: UvrD-helicase domain-containing protein [Rickettsiales bacterium]|jgi:ATP-dependent helicase/nuclease subunit A|nr:UvrD-helicase domain-containing protein [Rickettsiales bacterium]